MSRPSYMSCSPSQSGRRVYEMLGAGATRAAITRRMSASSLGLSAVLEKTSSTGTQSEVGGVRARVPARVEGPTRGRP